MRINIATSGTIGDDGRLNATGDTFGLEADIVFKAIGQRIDEEKLGDELAGRSALSVEASLTATRLLVPKPKYCPTLSRSSSVTWPSGAMKILLGFTSEWISRFT